MNVMDEGQTRHLNCFISPLMLNLIDKVSDELMILMKLRSCIVVKLGNWRTAKKQLFFYFQ